MIKRFFDFILSSIGIIMLAPFLIMISMIVKLTSTGPIFFKQRRIGKDNKEFVIYKFRTMRTDTPDVATDLLENPDVFITDIGKVLRKTSLDELPQLINVLKGDMSFVGPRPALYNQYELINLRTKAGVHRLVPGITGWAQINGRDQNDDFQKTGLDEYYMKNRSLKLDIKIVFNTVFKVLKAEDVLEGGNVTVKSKENINA